MESKLNYSPVISVIVPAFNAEGTIRRALDSILEQSFCDFELIVVDDGSDDKTLEIIQEYTFADSRVKSVTGKHAGVAVCRQKGLDIAVGDYTIFVDSDDWIDSQMLECLYKCASNNDADMVICDINIIQNHGSHISEQNLRERNGRECIPFLFTTLHGSLCNKLIRRDCYIANNISFVNGINVCEDLLVVLKLLDRNVSTAYVNKPLYNYDKTGASITNHWLDVPVREKVMFLAEAAPIADRNNSNCEFNDYVAKIAYNAVFASYQACPNYAAEFSLYKNRILSSNLSLYKKIIVLLYLKNLRIPCMREIKLRRISKNRKRK